MGSHTVYKLITATLFIIIVLAPAPALAQGPTPEIPYDFEPVDYESAPPTGMNLFDIISSVGFINAMGSYVVTVWAMLDDYAGGGVLGYFVIFLLGLVMIRFVARYVYRKPISGPEANFSQAIDTVEKLDPDGQAAKWAEFGREMNRRKNNRF